jgi:hypothetical protein
MIHALAAAVKSIKNATAPSREFFETEPTAISLNNSNRALSLFVFVLLKHEMAAPRGSILASAHRFCDVNYEKFVKNLAFPDFFRTLQQLRRLENRGYYWRSVHERTRR